jgi:Flp pilus assembly pilin Flp
MNISRTSSMWARFADARRATTPKFALRISGYWMTIAVCLVIVLAAMPPRPLLAAQTPLVIDISASVGPIAVQLNITKVVAQPGGLFSSTLHMHARDDTQTPVFNADLIAIGQAPDANTLLGGFLPAALIVKQDLLAGMTFEQASADAQAKTGVAVTFLNDVSMAEYALLLFLISVALLTGVVAIQPGLGDQACAIRAKLQAGIAALGFQNPPDPCGRGAIIP